MVGRDYRIEYSVDRPPKVVFDAIHNVRGWWSGEISRPTDRLRAVFTYRYQDIDRSTRKITEFVEGKRVVWRNSDSYLSFATDPAEWDGTEIVFEIRPGKGRSILRFTHQGPVPQIECHDRCSDARGFYIKNSLGSLITSGRGSPNEPGWRDYRGESTGRCRVGRCPGARRRTPSGRAARAPSGPSGGPSAGLHGPPSRETPFLAGPIQLEFGQGPPDFRLRHSH